MINIKIMCVGKIKDKNLLSLINEYQKRISKYAKLEIIDVEDEKIPSSLSSMDMENIKEKETKICLSNQSKLLIKII